MVRLLLPPHRQRGAAAAQNRGGLDVTQRRIVGQCRKREHDRRRHGSIAVTFLSFGAGVGGIGLSQFTSSRSREREDAIPMRIGMEGASHQECSTNAPRSTRDLAGRTIERAPKIMRAVIWV